MACKRYVSRVSVAFTFLLQRNFLEHSAEKVFKASVDNAKFAKELESLRCLREVALALRKGASCCVIREFGNSFMLDLWAFGYHISSFVRACSKDGAFMLSAAVSLMSFCVACVLAATPDNVDDLRRCLAVHHQAAFEAFGHPFFTINSHKLMHMPTFIELFGPTHEFSVR